MILTQRQLNRAVLARQGLLERRELDLPAALDAMAGLQAQYAPSMYIGLWSRVAGLERDAVTRALEDRSIVQGTLMRFTIHLVSAADYWPLTLAIRDSRRAWWTRVSKHGPLDEAAATLRAALKDGPLRRKEIDALIGKEALQGVGAWVDMVRVPPQGTWEKRRADNFGLAEDWLPQPPVDDPVGHLVRRYLTGFGPAAKGDIANWAGMGIKEIEPALDGLDTHEAEDGTTLYDLPDLPLPDPDTPAPVRFLPTWDATLLVHARRALILPEAFRERIFHTKMPQSIGTFLVDGQVAGTWKPDGTVTPFVDLNRRQRAQVDKEARALAEFSA
ncbi:AlkZ family DNA glycosylase [Solirubrobacter sp. CPCC 204708]|uniref:Winged helix DNA-binding domain-containing protein n=1 Tax=Solirubrobacter deserti TaxID=2282478 RepID=A0ABT4RK39_9ACTN|nr:winged helix DNA-binding domain-containing protein [Solirubrobacter deserti]MBE2316864.1 AlkZ family DNA glycosylase [Solirubrobacter deserti]MDA0138919.1 winged helix DNA-binding domain-containing protein [Solirubrobacter deserti]